MGIVLLIVLLPLFIWLLTKAFSSSNEISIPSNESNYNEPIKIINGVPVQITDEEIKQQSIRDFEEAVRRLKSAIKQDMENTDDNVRKKVLENLYQRSIHTQTALCELDYLYNDGHLRTNEEVKIHNEWKQYSTQRENYNEECHKRNILYWLIPFIIVFVIVMCIFDWFILGIPIALIAGLVAAVIGSLIANSINIKRGEDYHVDEFDTRFQQEKLNKKIGIASSIAAGYSIGKNTKRATKDLLNVDSWKEMK